MHITTNSHTLYIYIFHYYLIPAPDYTVIISFLLFAPYFFRGCTVIISFPLFAPYFSRGCTVIISFPLFAPYFFRDCTVIISFLLFAPYFFRDCTVIIPFLLFAPYFCDDCTVIIPFLLFAPYFCDDCTVIIHISFLCIVFLSNISSNIKNKRIVEINDSLIIHECRRPESNRYGYHYPRDFKSRASASSATAAYIILWGL